MPPIYIAGTLTTVLALGIFALLVHYSAPRELRARLWLLLLLELPLQPLAFWFVRMPVDKLLRPALGGIESWSYNFAAVFYAPVTEELAKLLPVAALVFCGWIRKEHLRTWMLPIGFGFGIGEAWLIAVLLARKPELAQIPWFGFGGYVSERLMVCFIHAAMTGTGLMLSLGHGRVISGVVLAMALHYAVNFPLYFFGPHVLKFGPTAFSFVTSLWVAVAFLAALMLVLGGKRAAALGAKLFGRAQCSLCGNVFNRSLWGLNFGIRRFERCPHCNSWIWTSEYHERSHTK